MTRWCQARRCLLLGRRDEMRLFLDYTRCPVEAWLRRLRVPTCPHAARRWRLAFSSRMLVSVCSWTTESRSPLLASSTSMGHTGSWWTVAEEWHSSFHETNHLFVSISSRFCSDFGRGRLAPEYITAKHRREVWDQVPELIKKFASGMHQLFQKDKILCVSRSGRTP